MLKITMSSTVLLTSEIRSIPYFSSFSESEKTVVVPRLFINESINYNSLYNIENIEVKDIITIIENRVYLNLDNDELIKELLWKIGESEEKINSILQNSIIQQEIKPYFETANSNYLYGIRCRIKLSCDKIAIFGNLRLLKWARENGCPWDESTCSNAALNGHLEVLKWARENGCPWNEFTCRYAALNGHLEVLKYLRKNNCPWDEWTCRNAAYNGHLEVLKWARENGCPE